MHDVILHGGRADIRNLENGRCQAIRYQHDVIILQATASRYLEISRARPVNTASWMRNDTGIRPIHPAQYQNIAPTQRAGNFCWQCGHPATVSGFISLDRLTEIP